MKTSRSTDILFVNPPCGAWKEFDHIWILVPESCNTFWRNLHNYYTKKKLCIGYTFNVYGKVHYRRALARVTSLSSTSQLSEGMLLVLYMQNDKYCVHKDNITFDCTFYAVSDFTRPATPDVVCDVGSSGPCEGR